MHGQNGYQVFNVSGSEKQLSCNKTASTKGSKLSRYNHVITLPFTTDQLNTTVQETTAKTPYELVFGQAPRHGLNITPTAGQIAEEDIRDIIETSSGMASRTQQVL